MNYIGYFTSCNPERQYSVKIISEPDSNDFKEIMLSGDEPFVVSYDNSATPFEAVRTSTATIGIVSNDYLLDAFGSLPDSTVVILTNETDNIVEWTGYLSVNVLNQSFEKCYEHFNLIANDCLLTLQYFDYELTNGIKNIVTFKSIIEQICNKTNLNGYYVTRSKTVEGHIVYLDDLTISEQNFFTSDTDEPWKLDAVLEEICRYLGYTALQWKDELYLIDYQFFSKNNSLSVNHYVKSEGYSAGTASLGSKVNITEDNLRGGGADVSLTPIYNKVTVNDSFYRIENLVPELFKDDFLTNRYGDIWECRQIQFTGSSHAKYVTKGGIVKEEKTNDNQIYNYRKLFDNKYYESKYYDDNLVEQTLTDSQLSGTDITRAYIGGTLCSIGSEKMGQLNADMSFQDYLLISMKDYSSGYWPDLGNQPVVYKLKDGYKNPMIVNPSETFITINFKARFERYTGRDWINNDWYKLASGGGIVLNLAPSVPCILKVGNKWWNGTTFQDAECQFDIVLSYKEDEEEKDVSARELDVWNTELNISNNMSWDLWTGSKGYKINLNRSGINQIDDIQFAICKPARLQGVYGQFANKMDGMNSYCWVKDVAVKIVNRYGDVANQDVEYSDIILEDAVMDGPSITCKITTKPDNEYILSYSHVGYDNAFLEGIEESSLSGTFQKPEENIIERYVNEFSTPTLSENLSLDLTYTPYQKVHDNYWNKDFVVLGQDIDYRMGKQTINLMEIK